MRRTAITLAALALLVPLTSGATTDGYDPTRAGHPVRIAAYALHPVGVLLDRLIFHPAWRVGQHEPFRTWFGVEPAAVQAEAPAEAPEAD